MVAALVPTLDGTAIRVGSVAVPNASLEDHWASGPARSEVASGGWDVVVMQQGPSSLPESRVNLIEWAGRFADEARAGGARPALLTVWPSEGRAAFFGDVVASYAAAADASGSALYPAGAAWQAAREAGTVDPYGPDRFHPSPAGTYLAALVVAGGLTGETTVGLPALGVVDAATARALQEQADAALAAVE